MDTTLKDMIANDISYFDFIQTASYLTRGDGDVFTTAPGVVALRQAVSGRTREVGVGTVTTDESTWHVRASDMVTAGVTPAILDRLLDDGGNLWYVTNADLETLDTRWRFLCRRVKNP